MKHRLNLGLWALAVLVVGILLGAVVGEVVDQGRNLDEATADRRALASDVEVLRDQVASLGAEPEVGPPTPGERGEPGEQGERGERGLPGRDVSDAQVAAAVANWFFTNPLTDHPDPDDPETQDPELQDDEVQDDEIQDPEEQEPEIQDAEVQDPEVDDPDPDDVPGDGDCPPGYSLQPSTVRGVDVLVCTRDEP